MNKHIAKTGLMLILAAQLCGQVLLLDYRDGECDSLRLDEIAYFYVADSSAEVVRLTSPYNGESNVDQNPAFSWREVSGQTYELLLSRSESFMDTVYHVSGLENGGWTPPAALEIQTRYYWKVRIDGKSLWTAAWSFSTWTPALPEKISTLALLQGDQSGSIRIAALLPLMVEDLLVVSGFDGLRFPDTLQCDSSGSVIGGLEPDSCYYMRIAGVNAAGRGPFSELLAIRPSRDTAPVLIVNGFDRATAGNTYNFVRQHASAVRNSGRIPVSASNEAVTEGLLSLDDHAAVIWVLGEESTVDETFSDAEQDSVESYLKNGGTLFVSGAEIAWDLDYKGSDGDKAFCHDFLRVRYVQDSPNNAVGTYYGVEATGPELFSELNAFSFDNGTHGSYDVRYPDVLGVSGESRGFLKYTGCNTGFAGLV
ncbi:MAG: fibronectin type III domain-containing protein, partial [Candidatus Marinimicrobia bacterium]|nr:fibronectin type III domain-containing protein [Candidatus Neomarinimicrobiota bacterium]